MELKSYENVTIAGFHALHRRMWGEIAENLKQGKAFSKKCFMEKYDLPQIPYNCFACLVSVGKIVTDYAIDDPYNCKNCPVIVWNLSDKGVPCTQEIRFSTPDDYACEDSVLDVLLSEKTYLQLSEYAEYIRDLNWIEDSNQVFIRKG